MRSIKQSGCDEAEKLPMSEEPVKQFNGEYMDAQKHVKELADTVDKPVSPKVERPEVTSTNNEDADRSESAEPKPNDEVQEILTVHEKSARWSEITSEDGENIQTAQQIRTEQAAHRAEVRAAEQKERRLRKPAAELSRLNKPLQEL